MPWEKHKSDKSLVGWWPCIFRLVTRTAASPPCNVVCVNFYVGQYWVVTHAAYTPRENREFFWNSRMNRVKFECEETSFGKSTKLLLRFWWPYSFAIVEIPAIRASNSSSSIFLFPNHPPGSQTCWCVEEEGNLITESIDTTRELTQEQCLLYRGSFTLHGGNNEIEGSKDFD